MILCIYWQPHNMNSIVHVVISHYMRPHILDKPKRHTAFGWIHAIFWLWNMQKTSQQFRVPACKHIPPSVWGLSSNLGWRHPNCHHNLDTHTHISDQNDYVLWFYSASTTLCRTMLHYIPLFDIVQNAYSRVPTSTHWNMYYHIDLRNIELYINYLESYHINLYRITPFYHSVIKYMYHITLCMVLHCFRLDGIVTFDILNSIASDYFFPRIWVHMISYHIKCYHINHCNDMIEYDTSYFIVFYHVLFKSFQSILMSHHIT